MHRTLERIQVDATPAVCGPLRVYFVGAALLLTATATRVGAFAVATVAFGTLTLHAVGRAYFGLVRYPLAFLLPSVAVVAVITPGTPVAAVWRLSVTEQGLATAATVGLRAVASLTVLSFLVSTTTVPQFVAALDDLRLPDPVTELLLLVYRGIQVLVAESARLHAAARLRGGFRSRRHLLRTTKLVSASLLVSAVERATAFGTAMESRNYDGRMPVATTENRGHAVVGAVLLALVAARWVV
ncbi:energy-coupling factor transporter transmembrane component T family protein [Halobellus ruber]|uniref:CbiQ family ECF transporter T component n=1 Tax=Halobellus ruber TaxID=2761102 RepID=A0A7J9SKE7_9EURY|nr:CbiQ family ECF transporter T component [Halobellus ruber]MBB6647405.1 CbiQ family ECF transporter T component [Halobellus ruber]